MTRRILLADDHSIVTSGLKFSIYNINQKHVIDVAESCTEIMKQLKNQPFTHLITDIGFPDGTITEILPNITSLYPKLQIMIFSMQPAYIYAHAVKKYGVHSYVEKSATDSEITKIVTIFLRNIT